MERQLPAEHLRGRHPDQARRQYVDINLEVLQQGLAAVAAQRVVARGAGVDQGMHARRRQRADQVVLQAIRIDGEATAFGGMRRGHAGGTGQDAQQGVLECRLAHGVFLDHG
ncbi:hypothetical protein MAFF211491_18100 [Ralstonia solanacearum]|nr:hypothetical protein MAFF211491_18100 [Ralstonia solanacearum]BCM12733.1 hypothetical protein MAFF241648_19230 [Ralstonia solanacearum]